MEDVQVGSGERQRLDISGADKRVQTCGARIEAVLSASDEAREASWSDPKRDCQQGESGMYGVVFRMQTGTGRNCGVSDNAVRGQHWAKGTLWSPGGQVNVFDVVSWRCRLVLLFDWLLFVAFVFSWLGLCKVVEVVMQLNGRPLL